MIPRRLLAELEVGSIGRFTSLSRKRVAVFRRPGLPG